MIGFHAISWPFLKRHRLRWVLTITGVALGVAVLVAMQAANSTVLNAFRRTIDVIGGETQLEIFGDDAGFSEDVLNIVESCAGVRVAAPIIEQTVDTDISGQGTLLVLGVDMLRDGMLRKYDFEPNASDIEDDVLAFLAQANALVITQEFARRNHLSVGSEVRLRTADGPKQFVIRGILRPRGLARAFGGNLAIMDIYAAQQIFGRGHVFDRIDLAVAPGTNLSECQSRLSQMLGPAFRVAYPVTRAQSFEALLQVYSRMMNLLSVLALIVGVFVIHNSFSIAVTQRRTDIGILRAIGARRGEIRRIFLVEGAVIGIAASLLGVGGGVLIAQASLKFISRLVEVRYAVSIVVSEITVSPLMLASAFAAGVLVSIVAAALPAEAAALTHPTLALQRGRYQILSTRNTWVRNACAAFTTITALVFLLAGSSSLVFYLSYVLSIFAMILFSPGFVMLLTRVLTLLVRRLRAIEIMLSTEGLLQAPRRTAWTVSALMLSVAAVVVIAGVSNATYASISRWLSTTLNPDLLVTSSPNVASHSFLFPRSMESELKAISGVDDLQGVRTIRVTIVGAARSLMATNLQKLFHRTTPDFVAGTAAVAQKLATEGKGVIISENLATLQSIRLYEPLQIPTPTGVLTLPVVGVIRDFTSQEGSILIDEAVFQREWKSNEVDLFRIYLLPSVAPNDIKKEILRRLGGGRPLFVFTNKELREYVFHVVDEWFDLTYVQVIIAVSIAILGIANTMFVSVTDRAREFAVLRAIGAFRRQIKIMIYSEAMLIALIAVITGISLGAVNLYYTLELCRRGITGLNLRYEFPWRSALMLIPLICGAGFVSSVWPARSAVAASLGRWSE